MRKIITSVLAVALIACASAAFGGQVWTDSNGDGQPDVNPVAVAAVSQTLTISLFIDSQSFAYTAYNIWAEWQNGISRVAGQDSIVGGCSTDPIDTFSHPRGIGFAGATCAPAKHGVNRIGRFRVHIDALPVPGGVLCVTPIIDPANQYNVFSLLASPAGYMLFPSASGTCVNNPVANGSEDKSWGAIKGLYNN